MKSRTTGRIVNSMRGQIAAGGAAQTLPAAETLFRELGQPLLSEASRQGLRSSVEQGATLILQDAAPELVKRVTGRAANVLPAAASSAGRQLVNAGSREVAKVASREVVKAASVEVLKGAGRAAGLGLALDGTVAVIEAVHGYHTGRLEGGEAWRHVAREAGTGAAAAGGGVIVAAGVVALTGGMAALPLAAVAISTSLGIKRGLLSLLGC